MPKNALNHGLTEAEESAILDQIARWLERDVAPHVMRMEHEDEYPHAMVEQMKEFGLFAATVSPEFGGLGLSARTYSRIITLISEQWMSLAGIFNSHLMLATIVETFGTDLQRNYWLPRLVTGEIRGGLALTEPDAGTDLQGIRTTARRDGNVYVVNGTKTWISNGIEGSVFATLVKTDPEAKPARAGMSMMITPKFDPDTMKPNAGFSTGRKLEKLGYKGIDSAELIFDDCRLDADRHLVSGEEGRGFYMAVGGLELGRINVAARSVGIAKRALDESLAYARVRKTFGKPIGDHQAIQLKLGDMATRTKAAELLVREAAETYDRGERADMIAGMAKYFASEAAMENAAEAMRIHGGYGYSTEYPVERLYREAPLMCIGEGTNEMQRIIIARQLLAEKK